MIKLNEKIIEQVRKSFLGEQLQRPPRYSAVKVDGKRAYEYARDNINVEIKEKDICIYNFILTEVDIPKISFEITCSKGTYIRSIARDFGDRLKCGAVLSMLRRTKIGDYDVENALRINNLVEKIKEEKIENSK